jgi:hypothetical protein
MESKLNKYRIIWVDVDKDGEKSNEDHFIIEKRSVRYRLDILIENSVLILIWIGFIPLSLNLVEESKNRSSSNEVFLGVLISTAFLILFTFLSVWNSIKNTNGWDIVSGSFDSKEEAQTKINSLIKEDNSRFKRKYGSRKTVA